MASGGERRIAPFEFATAGRVIFGAGARHGLGEILTGFGKHLLIASGFGRRHDAWLETLLVNHGLAATHFSVSGEPTLDVARAGAGMAREAHADLVLGIGGGSVLDAAKAIAALATQSGDVLDYLEGIGAGKPLDAEPLPCVAVPTTAGTGSEVTKNAVLGSPEHGVKVSLRSPKMLPRVAVVDPELALSMPRHVTAATGLDALAQLIEPFVSSKRQPITDGLCREGLAHIRRGLRAACREPSDLAAREAMSLASLLGGMALANAGLGAVHGFAGPIGGMFPAPHGVVCAILLPGVMEVNIQAARTSGDDDLLARFTDVARVLTGDTAARPDDGVAWVKSLVTDLEIPPLATYGITASALPQLVSLAKKASSMKGNPIVLPDHALTAILAAAIG